MPVSRPYFLALPTEAARSTGTKQPPITGAGPGRGRCKRRAHDRASGVAMQADPHRRHRQQWRCWPPSPDRARRPGHAASAIFRHRASGAETRLAILDDARRTWRWSTAFLAASKAPAEARRRASAPMAAQSPSQPEPRARRSAAAAQRQNIRCHTRAHVQSVGEGGSRQPARQRASDALQILRGVRPGRGKLLDRLFFACRRVGGLPALLALFRPREDCRCRARRDRPAPPPVHIGNSSCPPRPRAWRRRIARHSGCGSAGTTPAGSPERRFPACGRGARPSARPRCR